jgi:hypothetical protein
MSTPASTRTEYRIQQRRTTDTGTTVWVDLCPLPAHVNPDDAACDVRDLPSRRIVKVHVTETFEVLP